MLRRTLILFGLVAVLAAAGCGSTTSTSPNSNTPAGTTTTTVHFAKTKFLFHAGLAFGAFHHFVYLPIKAGDLSHPFTHKLTIVKMGLAGLFVYHEVKLAAQDVKADPLLSKLFSPLTALAAKVKALGSSLAGGTTAASSADQVNSGVSSLESAAAASGQTIKESLPSTAQLAAGSAQ